MAETPELPYLFAVVRRDAASSSPEPYSAPVDEAAKVVAQRIRSKLSANISLSWDGWQQLTAIIQSEVAMAIRHAAYEMPKFPGRLQEGRDYTRKPDGATYGD